VKISRRFTQVSDGGKLVETTVLLQRLEAGDRSVIHIVIPLVYEELKKLAKSQLRREVGPVMQTTALVHEAFLKLAGSRYPSFENRSHFFGIASRVMRQILVDAARARTAEKRCDAKEIPIAELPDLGPPPPNRHLLAMDDALRLLEKEDPSKSRLIEMKYFGGMTAHEISIAVASPVHIVRRELRLAQAWLRKEMAVA
jgi:RNA polymerase sigma-70 factor, ECF subfamily